MGRLPLREARAGQWLLLGGSWCMCGVWERRALYDLGCSLAFLRRCHSPPKGGG